VYEKAQPIKISRYVLIVFIDSCGRGIPPAVPWCQEKLKRSICARCFRVLNGPAAVCASWKV